MNRIARGGAPTYRIVIRSVMATATIVERTVVFLLTAERATGIESLLRSALRGNVGALKRLEGGRGAPSAVAYAYYTARLMKLDELEKRVFYAGTVALRHLRRRLRALLRSDAGVAYGEVLRLVSPLTEGCVEELYPAHDIDDATD